jgi:hypothetical protein
MNAYRDPPKQAGAALSAARLVPTSRWRLVKRELRNNSFMFFTEAVVLALTIIAQLIEPMGNFIFVIAAWTWAILVTIGTTRGEILSRLAIVRARSEARAARLRTRQVSGRATLAL